MYKVKNYVGELNYWKHFLCASINISGQHMYEVSIHPAPK